MRLVAALVWCALWGHLLSTAHAQTLPGPLVTANWLAENRGKVVVLDVRSDPKSFTAEGHIPGSVLINWSDVRTKRVENGVELEDMLPPADKFQALLRRSGVNADSSVVVSNRGREPAEMFLATRLYWQFKYYGHDAVAVLNGGTGAWAADGRPLSKNTANPKLGNWSPKAERQELLATTMDVDKAVQSRSPALTDSRRMEIYFGTERFKQRVTADGHIPGAKYADALLFVLPARPVLFRPPEELRQIADGLGIKASEPMITYCDTGDWGSGTWFVFHELLGNKNTRLYDGSMHAWTRNQSRPVVKFKKE